MHKSTSPRRKSFRLYAIATTALVGLGATTALIAGVTPAEAESILKFRGEHGPFADFDALAKVSGLDVKKLDQKKEALTF